MERDLTPMEAWTHFCGTNVDAGLKVYCRLILDCIQVALTKKVGDDKSPLALMRPAAPLAVRYLNHHHHNILTRHLPRLDPALQMVQVILIATHIREIGV